MKNVAFHSPKPHQTQEVILKKANIDKKLIPLVKWMNKIGLITQFCCQGNRLQDPYVLFYVPDINILPRFLYKLNTKVKELNYKEYRFPEVTVQLWEGNLRYTLTLKSSVSIPQ
jgi:hypothetical protein